MSGMGRGGVGQRQLANGALYRSLVSATTWQEEPLENKHRKLSRVAKGEVKLPLDLHDLGVFSECVNRDGLCVSRGNSSSAMPVLEHP